jgi:hypothetical protein
MNVNASGGGNVRPQCTLVVDPSADPDLVENLTAQLKTLGISTCEDSALAVHVTRSMGVLPVLASQATRTVLRVRQVPADSSSGDIGGPNWPLEVTLELLIWLLVKPPPELLLLEATVPERPHSGVPRLSTGLNDPRRIILSPRTADGSELSANSSLWATEMVSSMAARWALPANCECC